MYVYDKDAFNYHNNLIKQIQIREIAGLLRRLLSTLLQICLDANVRYRWLHVMTVLALFKKPVQMTAQYTIS